MLVRRGTIPNLVYFSVCWFALVPKGFCLLRTDCDGYFKCYSIHMLAFTVKKSGVNCMRVGFLDLTPDITSLKVSFRWNWNSQNWICFNDRCTQLSKFYAFHSFISLPPTIWTSGLNIVCSYDYAEHSPCNVVKTPTLLGLQLYADSNCL